MKTRGFTLIESLVAVAIVALAVGGPLYAANRALVAAEISRDRLTAIYLAQEAIEQARHVRDTAYLNDYKNNGQDTSGSWQKFRDLILTGPVNCRTPSICTVEPTSHQFAAYTPPAVPPPLYNDSAGTRQYTQNKPGATSKPTIFTRTIQVVSESTTDPVGMELAATTSWTFHGTSYSVTITDHLTAWQ
ncbi:hypothetical protein COU19_03195 [Candidatus Kaiserbacteria bacterium CG10_big_fil_rev_8_21_14_0_10_56_12]|uniref:Type II secretion system protein GspI C-terminal domain-containing protein n=1 Tax=Candidatus Kaiserbacteria bacterium CG10_big_fil_rev_8_21_14_0_10_56_12 TaxID=1974611 RepID=A0A2H0UAW1_9BACT|nr:MAG: hypothetical protein COU19_03195 [Candidatus Kaiserbacteria bacterium CG10_big_fil_rev_8_21_14_0_10_56_12]